MVDLNHCRNSWNMTKYLFNYYLWWIFNCCFLQNNVLFPSETGYASFYDRIFFKDLARSMQNNQRYIKQSLRANIQSLYSSITKKLRRSNREYETENESGREGSEDENLNLKLLPLWRQHYRDIMKDVEKNIREMRYRVLALLNRHFKYRNYRHW